MKHAQTPLKDFCRLSEDYQGYATKDTVWADELADKLLRKTWLPHGSPKPYKVVSIVLQKVMLLVVAQFCCGLQLDGARA